jgi:hypothetical protein
LLFLKGIEKKKADVFITSTIYQATQNAWQLVLNKKGSQRIFAYPNLWQV